MSLSVRLLLVWTVCLSWTGTSLGPAVIIRKHRDSRFVLVVSMHQKIGRAVNRMVSDALSELQVSRLCVHCSSPVLGKRCYTTIPHDTSEAHLWAVKCMCSDGLGELLASP